ncbi:MAG: hypothetical protein ACO3EZ_17880 [Prochlorotrichaceae cyanobacterium]
MTQSPQNFTPPPDDGVNRGSGRANPLDFIPFIGFLGFVYIALTMGSPDRLPFEEPAKANQNPPIQPQCIAANPSPGIYEYRDCTPDELQENRPQVFNSLTQSWE